MFAHGPAAPAQLHPARALALNPYCQPHVANPTAGKRIDFVQHSDVAARYADQVAPYAGVFGCTLGLGGQGSPPQPWHGTLFRFPLRSSQLAATSTISKQVCSRVQRGEEQTHIPKQG